MKRINRTWATLNVENSRIMFAGCQALIRAIMPIKKQMVSLLVKIKKSKKEEIRRKMIEKQKNTKFSA